MALTCAPMLMLGWGMGEDESGLNEQALALGDDERLRAILQEVCAATGMGFAAVARVTENRWVACQVLDKINFGLDPGEELKISETICREIRESGEYVVFDDANNDIKWSRHPVPVIYGFKSYCSFPVYLTDGSFFGTLCAIDPARRSISDGSIVEMFSSFARKVGEILSERAAARGEQVIAARPPSTK